MHEEDRRIILDVIRQYFPEVEVLIYGSRVTGEAHPASDADLVLRHPEGQKLPYSRLLALRNALMDANTPISVDFHDWQRLPESFRHSVEAEAVSLEAAALYHPS
mgnify:CR=1 FL=1